MLCKKCSQAHDGAYGSGKFCSAHCARSFSTFEKREEINQKVSVKAKSKPFKPFGKPFAVGDGRKRGRGKARYDDVYTLPDGRQVRKTPYSCKTCNKKFYASIGAKGLCCSYKCHSAYVFKPKREKIMAGELVSESSLKRFLFETDPKCKSCGLDQWLGSSLTLHMHHEDGNPHNNILKNCWLLCPNCHSQTHNFGGKAIDRKNPSDAYRNKYFREWYKQRNKKFEELAKKLEKEDLGS